jgi:predicted negative regulator of RcsB-dependent stress response
MKSIFVIVLLAAVGWFGFDKYQDRVHAQREAELAREPAKKKSAVPLPVAKRAAAGASFFTCDQRTMCKQLTSCEEARYFVKNCPGFGAGVSGEDEACERQWCKP